MKFRINKSISERALRRFKWMCIAFVSLGTVSYFTQSGLDDILQTQFVEAAEDLTIEQDEVYQEYIRSAEMQKEQMKLQNKEGHKMWTFEEFQKQRQRKLNVNNQQYAKVYDEMTQGVDYWYENIPNNNWDKITQVKKLNSGKYSFKDESFESYIKEVNAQGFIEEYWNKSRCFSAMINTPGVSLLPRGLMATMYFLFMVYLFLGINISADIFMEAIDVITSKVQVITVKDEKTAQEFQMEVPVWNPTMANLTLMAFGSSAPEIILNVLEAVKDLGSPAGELGPSTIVGSAAFNLLVISGVSIAAVGPDIKKIDDMGVFLTTALFSIFAYIWLFLCLAVNSKGFVTVSEAAWTFGFFFILLVLAFGMDKYNQRNKAKIENEQTELQKAMQIKKSRLRTIARQKGDEAVLTVAQGQKHEKMDETDVQTVRDLYKELLEEQDLSKVPLDSLMNLLKPDTLFERFAARKQNAIGASKEFLEIKGQKFQIENSPATPVQQENEFLAFKCLHYSVTESAGTVTITIIKKSINTECTFGIRTRDGTAKSESQNNTTKDYEPIDEIFTVKKRDIEKTVEIIIHDNQDWQPDLDFYVELYDTKTHQTLHGDDTVCKVTILDEDFPGKLGFELTEITAQRDQEKVDIVIKRFEGTDGKISCMVRTESLLPDKLNPQNAIEFEDYLPKHEKVEFNSGESEKIVPIYLVKESDDRQIDGKGKELDEKANLDDEDEEDEDEEFGPKFKIVLEKPEPDQVKISKKNCCTVELIKTTKNVDVEKEHRKVIQYFVEQASPTWGSQFKKAVMLCPKIDEDDLIVSEVELMEALSHFAIIGWKVLFAFIPPVEWSGGWPAFFVALTFIGGITAVVAEVATVLGCVLGLEEAVTAITIVAIGTSLPDTFASMTAAKNSQYADSAIGNVTGSNSVNVFVGLGLPWLISSIYQDNKGEQFETPPGNLAFSVMLFLITSLTCFAILGIRRACLGGELGGPQVTKYFSAIILVCLWLIYVVFSSLRAYNLIEGI